MRWETVANCIAPIRLGKTAFTWGLLAMGDGALRSIQLRRLKRSVRGISASQRSPTLTVNLRLDPPIVVEVRPDISGHLGGGIVDRDRGRRSQSPSKARKPRPSPWLELKSLRDSGRSCLRLKLK